MTSRAAAASLSGFAAAAAGGEAWAKANRTGDGAAFLEAALRYAEALADPDGLDELRLRGRQRDCWDRAAVALGGVPVGVPYRHATIKGVFFPAREAPGARPLIVVAHDGIASEAWAGGGAVATACGWHWMALDALGPLDAFTDKWAPDALGAFLAASAGHVAVDGRRVVAVGLGLASLRLVACLARHHECCVAAVVAPGIVDPVGAWLATLPSAAATAFEDGDAAAFDRELHLAELFAPGTLAAVRRAGRIGDAPGRPSLFAVGRRLGRLRVGDDALGRIRTPLLICDPAAPAIWDGQSDALNARLPRVSTRLDATPCSDAALGWLAGYQGASSPLA